MYFFLAIIGLAVVISLLYWMGDKWSKAKKYDKLKPKLHSLDVYKRELESKESQLKKYDELKPKLDSLDVYKRELESKESQLKSQQEHADTIIKEKSQGFPWLAQAFADYFHLQDLKQAEYLEHKSHPAPKAAERVREIASRRRIAEQLYRVLNYKLEYYENLFPWLVDFTGEDVDDLIVQIIEKSGKGAKELEEPEDAAKKLLTEAEYNRMSTVAKYQLALDRYWQKKKSKWEIGRDYERYIGYLYETTGHSVYYQGIIEGLQDLGRDLIATSGDKTEVIQCKNWSQQRTVHEKHIFQLFGTTIEYWLKHRERGISPQLELLPGLLQKERIKATFITSTKLSEKAREFAKVLGVQVLEDFPLQRYPSIKCNVSRQTGSEKIYHLPFDQQYDRTIIEQERNECYVETVAEAEALGFRRASRWRGSATE
jgi:hypothetical protein